MASKPSSNISSISATLKEYTTFRPQIGEQAERWHRGGRGGIRPGRRAAAGSLPAAMSMRPEAIRRRIDDPARLAAVRETGLRVED